MKRKLYILFAVLVLAGLTATAQIKPGKKLKTSPKTEQTKKTSPSANQGQTKKKQGTKQQSKGSSLSSTKKSLPATIQQAIDDMVYVEGGTFMMGATAEQGSDVYDERERPAHQVTLSSYYISKYEVTQELWQAVMGTNPSYFKGDLRRPVENVSWKDCQEFIRKLNRLTGKRFRLPTEAEWEYAARGGKKSRGYKSSGSDNPGSVAWYSDNSDYTTHPVGQQSPNELDLYDMIGNVCEWCQDWYAEDYYSISPKTNPTGPASGSDRVIRGGSCFNYARYCRVSYRDNSDPSDQTYSIGLRLAL